MLKVTVLLFYNCHVLRITDVYCVFNKDDKNIHVFDVGWHVEEEDMSEGNMQTRLKQIRGKKQSYIEVSKEMWIKALLSARPGN